MAQLTFSIADGNLTIGSANRTYDYASTDYRAKAWRNGDRNGVKVFPLNGDENKPRWSVDDFTEFALVIDGIGYSPASAHDFVEAFNNACGSNIGYNTQYPQHILSFSMTLDTSVPQQLTAIAKGGYMTIQAEADNTGVVYIGDSDVDDDSSYIEAGESKFVELDDLSKYYAFAEVASCVINVLGAWKY
jgi:hypothetical protein